MYVSVETLTTVISFAGLLIALAGGFGWMIRRSDAQFRELGARIDAQGVRLDTKIDQQTARLDAKIEEQGRALESKIEAQTRELIEVKIAVARLEGPRPHIIPAR
ncbi:response regulator [Rathayibacter sp. CAU 1779]